MALEKKKMKKASTDDAPLPVKKKAKAAEEEMPVLIVASKVKQYIKDANLRCAGDFLDAFNKMVNRQLKIALKRAQGNNRSTLRPVDAV